MGFIINIYNDFADEPSGDFVTPLPQGVKEEECHYEGRSYIVSRIHYIRQYKQLADPGEGPGLPPYFKTKLRPEGSKKLFLETGPPYLRDDRDAPPSLKVWIRHCKQHRKCRHHRPSKVASKLATRVLVI